MARASRTSRGSSGRSRPRSSGGGMAVVFGIMTAIVAAVVVTGIVVGMGDTKEPAAPKQEPTATNYVSVKSEKRTDWPTVAPWNGLAVGMDKQAVIDRFGNPDARNVMKYKSLETLEFHNNPDRVGFFGDSGGVRLTVYIDTDTNKVVYFTPPKTAEQAIREYQESQNR